VGGFFQGGCQGKGCGYQQKEQGQMKKQVWDKPRPKGLGKSKALSAGQKASAKAAAKAAGRPYPNLVDNMRAAKKK